MAHKNKSPGAGAPRDPEKVSAVGTADTFRIALRPLEIQQNRLLARFNVSDAVARVIAVHAYGEAAR